MTIVNPQEGMAHPEENGGISMSNLPSATNATAMNSAPPSAAIDAIPMYEQPKLGSTCFGCCDFRRAVMIVDILLMGLSAYNSFGLILNPPNDSSTFEESQWIDDDKVQQELDLIANDAFLATAIIGGVLAASTAVPLYGAYSYKLPLIAFGIFLLVASFVAYVCVTYFVIEDADFVTGEQISFEQPYIFYALSALALSLSVYPHVGLILEIHQGIMSRETYPREEYSFCCGAPKIRRQPRPNSPQAFGGSYH